MELDAPATRGMLAQERPPSIATASPFEQAFAPGPRARPRLRRAMAVGIIVLGLAGGAALTVVATRGRGVATWSPAEPALAAMATLVDELCACHDLQCAGHVLKQMSAMKDPGGKPTQAQMDAARALAERMVACHEKLIARPLPPSSPPSSF